MQRPGDVAEQDHAIIRRLVVRMVDVGLVEHHPLAIAPALLDAVHFDVAAVVVGRGQAQVQAQRTGERVAVRAQFTARRQLREHRRAHVRQRLQQRRGLRAHRLRRRVRRAVPLQVEALPATTEERVEAGVVERAGGSDLLRIAQRQCLVADHLPVLAQRLQLRELLGRVQERGPATGATSERGPCHGSGCTARRPRTALQ
ncbi:hypothetical protein G6F35_015452 [Rhizopus arrhizus]|nr:hypothetical protein G6F35_015452 [Rhizopus arrhizus]